jgi:RND superfamily putative drug exporter
MSETRRRLALGEPRVVAARGATARIAPLVLVAGVLVAGGAVSLLAGRMQFFRVFGPGLAIAALVVTVVSVTLVPALMGLLGPRLFGGGRAEDGAELPRVLARLRTARPAAALIALLCAGALALAATGARPTHLGVSFVPSLPRGSEPWQAADAAAHGFVPGVVAPTELLLEQPGIGAQTAALARAQRLLAREPGVAAVVGPAQASGSALERFAVARGGGAARVALVLRDEPTGAAAIAALRRLERRLPALFRAAGLPNGVRASLGGETALAQETVDALVGDLERVGAATAVVMLVLLALFLRALVAPLLLLGGSVLSFAGSFGLTATLIGGDFVYYVPLVGAVMLIGLGSDYNVLIAGRIREEAGRRRLREAIAVAGPAASRAITVAGITLASTFALLAIVPLEPFRQLAALMTLGVLIDALVVRPLLIPALIALAGRRAWWPRPPGVPWTPPPGSPRECTPPAESRRG